jgi:hypothetical protein
LEIDLPVSFRQRRSGVRWKVIGHLKLYVPIVKGNDGLKFNLLQKPVASRAAVRKAPEVGRSS